jgi:hypothetical protein
MNEGPCVDDQVVASLLGFPAKSTPISLTEYQGATLENCALSEQVCEAQTDYRHASDRVHELSFQTPFDENPRPPFSERSQVLPMAY